jgi:hypothetical protein
MGKKRDAYRILVEKPERKRPLGRPRRRREDNIKMYLRGIKWGGMDWIDLAQDRDQWRALVNTVMNFGFHKMGNSVQLAASQEVLRSLELVSYIHLNSILAFFKKNNASTLRAR